MPTRDQIADQLRAAILSGAHPQGAKLPPLRTLAVDYQVHLNTILAAVSVLEAEGLVESVQGSGVVVLDRTRVQVTLSRYQAVLAPGGALGPWETACTAQGLDPFMRPLSVTTRPAPAPVAAALGLAEGAPAVCRHRHAGVRDPYTQTDRVLQIQADWFPAWLAEGTPLERPGKIVGGIWGFLASIGRPVSDCDETVTGRQPTRDEAEVLRLRGGGSVLVTRRVTRDRDGAPLTYLETISNPARVDLVYDGLPLR